MGEGMILYIITEILFSMVLVISSPRNANYFAMRRKYYSVSSIQCILNHRVYAQVYIRGLDAHL